MYVFTSNITARQVVPSGHEGFTLTIRDARNRQGGNETSPLQPTEPEAAAATTGTLRFSAAQWRATFDAISDIVCVISKDYEIVEINRRGCEAVGMPRKKIIGRKCFELVHSTRVPIAGCPCTRATLTHEPSTTTHEQDGRIYELTAWPIVGQNGQMEAFAHIVKDVTERERAEDEIKRQRDAQQLIASVLEMSLHDVSIDQVFERALDGILSIPWLSIERKGAIFLVDKDHHGLSMKAARNLTEAARRSCATVPFGTCLCGRCAASKSMVFSAHLDDYHHRRYEEIKDHGHYCVPIIFEHETLGVICTYLAPGHERRAEEEELLLAIANALAGVIARRQAQNEVEHKSGQLRALATELVKAEQRERQRLAKVLHDNIQQLLVSAKLRVGLLAGKSGRELQQGTDQVCQTLDEAINAARTLTSELSPQALQEQGLGAGLKWLQHEVKSRHGLNVDMQIENTLEIADRSLQVFLFEAVRELLFNVVKHAGVDQARVEVAHIDERSKVRVTVTDSGVGFTPERVDHQVDFAGGFGLFSIRERLNHLGGRMDVESAPGQGCRFVLIAPSRTP